MQQLLTNLSWLYKWYHNMHSHGQPVSYGQGWGGGWVPPPGWQVGGITQGQLSSHVLKYTTATYSENISLPQILVYVLLRGKTTRQCAFESEF